MSVDQTIGYAQMILDSLGISNIFPVMMTVAVAGMILAVFIGRRRD